MECLANNPKTTNLRALHLVELRVALPNEVAVVFLVIGGGAPVPEDEGSHADSEPSRGRVGASEVDDRVKKRHFLF